MGYYLGEKIPDYNPFWEEKEYDAQPDYWKWYHFGYDEGYGDGSEYRERLEKLEQENEALRNLLGANVRIIKEEIRKELATDTNIS